MRPQVLTEDATLDAVCSGTSISRVCDGELKIIFGRSIKSQVGDPRLAAKIRETLVASGEGKFLAGIVRYDNRSPKLHHTVKCMAGQYGKLYTAKLYGSTYITRPDCAPWINRKDYWDKLEGLWRGRDVVLVRGSTKSLHAALLTSAKSVHEIIAPRQSAFSEYDSILGQLTREAGDRPILLCLGPTATALAYDLYRAGHHAMDLGHAGMFLKKHWRGAPMVVTPEDKAA